VGEGAEGRARVPARRKDVPKIEVQFGGSVIECRQLREQRIAGTRSLPLLLIRFGRYADLFGHVDKLDNGFGLHFAHDLGAMDFYGDFAASQLSCDLLVK
jgi:hypothetical protein